MNSIHTPSNKVRASMLLFSVHATCGELRIVILFFLNFLFLKKISKIDEAVEHQRFLSGKKKGQCKRHCAGCQQLALMFGGLPGTLLL